jgi:hypothetical protein
MSDPQTLQEDHLVAIGQNIGLLIAQSAPQPRIAVALANFGKNNLRSGFETKPFVSACQII